MRLSLALLVGLGASSAALAQSAGDLVISEINIAPATGVSEWFEVVNVSGSTVDLGGCELWEGSGAAGDYQNWTSSHHHTVSGSLTVGAGGRLLLSKSGGDCGDCVEGCGPCTTAADYEYSSLSFNNTGVEHLAIVCGGTIIDEIPYDWGTFSGDCDLDGKNCSVNLRESLMDAVDNDNWDSSTWCVPLSTSYTDEAGTPARGTPARTNVCPVIGDACGVGDAVFTELMIAPNDGYDEWIELLGDTDCNLSGCELRLGASSDPLDGAEDWSSTELEGVGGNLPIGAGEYLLLSKSEDYIAGYMDGDTFVGELAADAIYSSIFLPNSDDEWLHLVCDGVAVDSAPVAWSAFDPYCPAGGCTVNLQPDAEDAVSNDDLSSWCVAPPESVWVGPSGEPFTGTPGSAGQCMASDWPAPGEVIFTELIASPQGGVSEYMELKNVSDAEVDLTFCSLVKYRVDGDGAEDPSTRKEHLIGSDGTQLAVDANTTQLLAYKNCLRTADGDTGAAGDGGCQDGEYLYDTIQLTADQEEHLELVCDGEVIDGVVFHSDAWGIRDGHSAMLDPGSETAEANDVSTNWCEASFTQKLDDLSFDEEEKCNYGTPGEDNVCLSDQADPPDPVCRCGTAGSPWAWWTVALPLVAFLGRRRRG